MFMKCSSLRTGEVVAQSIDHDYMFHVGFIPSLALSSLNFIAPMYARKALSTDPSLAESGGGVWPWCN